MGGKRIMPEKHVNPPLFVCQRPLLSFVVILLWQTNDGEGWLNCNIIL